MAKMIPRELQSSVKSNAEKRLFELFAKGLSDDYIVFHGVWWQHIKYIVVDREADFIIIHPDKGILILEAKGGNIEYDPVDRAWYQNGEKMKISPFQQARDIKYKFLEFLSKHDEFAGKDFCIGQCVSFTDIDSVANSLPSEVPQEILILRPQLQNIKTCIDSIFDYYKAKSTKTNLRKDRVEKIITLISPSTTFQKYIVNDIREIDRQIFHLTEQQYSILNNLCLHRQSIILGCAGSGKTQLAIEKARRLCQHKIKTIVTCKSSHLSLYINISLQDENHSKYCIIQSYEEIQSKKFKLDFDCEAIVIDEGQDFNRQEIEELKKLIPNDGIFYIFQDSNQNISTKSNIYNLPVNPTILDKNCRNTHKIFEYAKPFISCVHSFKSSMIEGKDVVTREYKNLDQIVQFLKLDILKLVKEENVLPHQIVVLTDVHPLSKSILSKFSQIDHLFLKQYSINERSQNIIRWSNIGMYKGLESEVVILCFEKPKTPIPSNWDIANKYIGATRAKSLLITYERPDPDIDF